MDKFLELVAEIFEVEPEKITMDTVFRELEGFCSMVGFSLIIMMRSRSGRSIIIFLLLIRRAVRGRGMFRAE